MHVTTAGRTKVAALAYSTGREGRLDMTMLTRLLALLALAFFLSPSPSRAARSTFVPLSASDRRIAFRASHLAPGHPLRALRWLTDAGSVARADLGRDGVTIQIYFRDGSTVALLPRTIERVAEPSPAPIHAHRAATGSTRAVVLEPFADDLGFGPTAG